MAAWADAIVQPLKTIGEIAQGLIEIRDTVKFGKAVTELLAQVVAAQQGALAALAHEAELIDVKRRLEAQIRELQAWEAEKQRYQLERLEPGVFVYTLKPALAAGEPPHRICQACYQRGKKFILQSHGVHDGLEKLDCHECGAVLRVGQLRIPPIDYGSGDEFP